GHRHLASAEARHLPLEVTQTGRAAATGRPPHIQGFERRPQRADDQVESGLVGMDSGEVGEVPDDLLVNKPRIGWFYDGDESTPATATLLQDTGEEITLTTPWVEEGGKSGAYARGFYGPNVIVGDDRDRTRYSHSVPPVLHFKNSDGLVALVGCRSRGGRSPMGRGAGHGVVGVQFAVVGAGPYDYGEIHGLRS